jgi:hypothetical protein
MRKTGKQNSRAAQCNDLECVQIAVRKHRWGLAALAAAGAVTAAVSTLHAEVITESATAPTTYVIGQPDYTGTLNGGQDYSNNGGPPAQSFTPTTSFNLAAVTVKGGGSDGSANQGGSTIWDITISSVSDSTSKVTVLDSESVAFFPTSSSDYLTLTLNTPIALSANTEYAYSIYTYTPSSTGTGGNNYAYYGFAKSSSDVLSGGYAFQEGTSADTTAAVGSTDTISNKQSDDRTFYVESTVPEPASLSILALGGLGVLQSRRRLRTPGGM